MGIADDESRKLMPHFLHAVYSRVAEGRDRLGFGLRPCQGFRVRGSISAGYAIDAASALFTPDMKISLIRLARTRSLRGMHWLPSLAAELELRSGRRCDSVIGCPQAVHRPSSGP